MYSKIYYIFLTLLEYRGHSEIKDALPYDTAIDTFIVIDDKEDDDSLTH